MSLQQLLQERKKHLNKSVTVVTTVTGDKYKETIDVDGVTEREILSERHAGFVIDNNPDLQVAQILPYLAIGSQDVAVDYDLMLNHKITHVLSIGVKLPIEFPDFQYRYVDLCDCPDENILEVLHLTNDLISLIRNDNSSNVFVHCNAGCSRAPSIVIGYLMNAYRLSYDEAFETVRRLRYIKPNIGFEKSLRSLVNNESTI